MRTLLPDNAGEMFEVELDESKPRLMFSVAPDALRRNADHVGFISVVADRFGVL